MGYNFIDYEKDNEYYQAANKRLAMRAKQGMLFEDEIKEAREDQREGSCSIS